jgi:hypothetical protein
MLAAVRAVHHDTVRQGGVPAGPDWLHGIKHDGYRLMAWRAPNVRYRGKNRHAGSSKRLPLLTQQRH